MGSQFLTPTDIDSLVRKFFSAVDSLSAPHAITFYAPDCRAQFGNVEDIRGATQLQKLFEGFFGILESLTHDVKSVSFDPDTATSYTVSTVTYVVKGDKERVRIVIPALTVMRFGRGDMKIEEFAVYFDPSAVFERAKVVAERARWGKIVLQGIGAVEAL